MVLRYFKTADEPLAGANYYLWLVRATHVEECHPHPPDDNAV
jgi:hypothetical protein